MTNTDKSNIIIEITQIINRRNKRWNSKKDITNIFNAWTNSTKYKIKDIDKDFLVWILSYIEDLSKMDTDIIKELAELEKEKKNEEIEKFSHFF